MERRVSLRVQRVLRPPRREPPRFLDRPFSRKLRHLQRCPSSPSRTSRSPDKLCSIFRGGHKEKWSAQPEREDSWGQAGYNAENWWNFQDWNARTPAYGATVDWTVASTDDTTESQGRALLEMLQKPKTQAPAPARPSAPPAAQAAAKAAAAEPAAQAAVQAAAKAVAQAASAAQSNLPQPKTAAQAPAVQAPAAAPTPGPAKAPEPVAKADTAGGVPLSQPAEKAAPLSQPTALEALLHRAASGALTGAVETSTKASAPPLYLNGEAAKRPANAKKSGFPLFATSADDLERDLLKEADSRPPSGPQAGLVADPEAGRFLLMQLKGPETIAREDGKRLLNHMRRSFEREDERKAARFMKLLSTKG